MILKNIRKKLETRKNKILVFCTPIILSIFTPVMYLSAHTDADEHAINVLTEFSGYFERWNLINFALRNLGWLITKGLWWLAEAMENMLDKAYSLVNFTTSTGVSSFMDDVEPILVAVFTLALVIFALTKVINPLAGGSAIVHNTILAILVICGTTTMMNTANTIVKDSRTFIKEMNGTSVSTADITVAEGISDVFVFEAYDFKNILKSNGDLKRPTISDAKWDKNKYSLLFNCQNLDYLEADERVDGDDDENPFTGEDVSETIFDNYLTSSGTAEEIDDGAIDFLRPQYYRYTIDFITIWITLIALIIVYLLSSYKVIRIIFELAIHRIVAPFFAAGDISNGKKLRQVLNGILGSYITLIVITMLQQMFLVAKTYITDKVSNPLYASLFIAFLALCVIDAPNLFEQVFGIDAGLKSGFAMFAAARTAVGAARMGGHAAKAFGGSVVGGAAYGSGALSGAFGGGKGESQLDSGKTSERSKSSGLDASSSKTSSNHSDSKSSNLSANEKATNEMSNRENVTQNQTLNENNTANTQMDEKNQASTKETLNAKNPKDTGLPNTPKGKDGAVLGANGKKYDDMFHQGSKNLTGRQYEGTIGGFLKQNTKVGQQFSKGQDFGNAIRNSHHGTSGTFHSTSDSTSVPDMINQGKTTSGSYNGQQSYMADDSDNAKNQAIYREEQLKD